MLETSAINSGPYFDLLATENLAEDKRAKLNDSDIVILPYLDGESSTYSQETVEFVKHCREVSPESEVTILDTGDIEVLSLNSIDIWMPIIFVAKDILLPFAVSMAASYAIDKMKALGRKDAGVKVSIMTQTDEKKMLFSYEGDVNALVETFEKIDLSNL